LTLELAAAYASGNSIYAPRQNGFSLAGVNFGFNYTWSAGAHLKYAVNEKLAIGFGGQYFADAYDRVVAVTGTPPVATVALGGGNDWAIGTVVDYKIVQGFDTKLAVNYVDGDNYADGAFNGFLRFQRSF